MDTTARQLWETALGELQQQVDRPTYDTWLRETVGISVEGSLITIATPSTFSLEWLESRFLSVARKTLRGLVGRPVEVQFVVADGALHPSERPRRAPAPRPQGQLPLQEETLGAQEAGLHPDLRFSSFIVGESNRLAYAAAQSLVTASRYSYNPLFFHGESGTGKTHLLQAIGHACLEQGRRVRYVTAESFTDDFVTAIRDRQAAAARLFRQQYRAVEVLLVDDVQFLAGKVQTQEGLFHTLNDLSLANRLVVLGSDRAPAQLVHLDPRLRSRFEGGLVVALHPPELETRIAILQTLIREIQLTLPSEIIRCIASHTGPSIRALRGSLNQVLAYAQLLQLPVTTALVEEVLSFLAPPATPQPSAVSILQVVSNRFSLELAALQGRRRNRKITLARHAAMFLLHEVAQLSLPEIGRQLGGRDPSTVRYGVERITQLLRTDTELFQLLSEIRQSLRAMPPAQREP